MNKKDIIGKVIHYYDKIGVAVVKLEKILKVEDRVKFTKGDKSFEQTIESMQLEHKPVTLGKKGEEVAIKVDEIVKSGTTICKP
jgi:putative protease